VIIEKEITKKGITKKGITKTKKKRLCTSEIYQKGNDQNCSK